MWTDTGNVNKFSRLVYSVWWEDFARRNANEANEIWSVGINQTTGDFDLNDIRREIIALPPISSANGGWSSPVSDISFKPDGRILLAERSMDADDHPTAHWSRLLQYSCPSSVVWERDLDTQTSKDVFLVAREEKSTAGGIDVGFGDYFPDNCAIGRGPSGRVWASADGLHQEIIIGEPWVYGLGGLPYDGGNTNDDNPFTCIYIDLDLEYTLHDKWEMGDVEIPCPPFGCCRIAGDANHDGKYNISDITFGIARIFAGGERPQCDDEINANGDNSFNIADVTYGIARIFAGGKAPVCGKTGT